jgi:serine/threonine protein kinase
LEKAHCSGVMHCELKPSNIMLTKSGTKPDGLRAGESASRRSWSEWCSDSLLAMLQR